MSNFDENKINRQASGTSAGGQFANKDHPANDGVGLAGSAEYWVQLVRRGWPKDTMIYCEQDGGDRVVHVTSRVEPEDLERRLSRAARIPLSHAHHLMKLHGRELSDELLEQSDTSRPTRYVGETSCDTVLEDGALVTTLEHRFSDEDISDEIANDPDALAEELESLDDDDVESFRKNRISTSTMRLALSNIHTRHIDRVGTPADILAVGDTVAIDAGDDYPGEWVVHSPAPLDPAREHREFTEEMRDIYGAQHPGAKAKAPAQVGDYFEVTESAQEKDWMEGSGLDPEHAAMQLGFERWWVTPADSNPLKGKIGPTDMPAVSNLHLRRTDLGG